MDPEVIHRRLLVIFKELEEEPAKLSYAYEQEYKRVRSLTHAYPYAPHRFSSFKEYEKWVAIASRAFWFAYKPIIHHHPEIDNFRFDFCGAFFCFTLQPIIWIDPNKCTDRDSTRFYHCIHDCIEARAVCLSIMDNRPYAEHIAELKAEPCLISHQKVRNSHSEELDYWANIILERYKQRYN